jgi:hypothetical protein
MPISPLVSFRVLVIAILLGLLGDGLVRSSQAKLGLSIWLTMLVGALLLFWNWRRYALFEPRMNHGSHPALFAVVAALGIVPIVRDAPMLLAANLLGVFVALLVLAWRAAGQPLTALQPRDALTGAAAGGVALMAGVPLLVQQLRRSDAATAAAAAAAAAGRRPRWLAIGVGAVVAAPILLATLLLLTSADPVFAALLDELDDTLDQAVVQHLLVIGVMTWLSAGVLLGSLRRVGVGPDALQRTLDLPFASAVPLLGGLTTLLGLWVSVQLRTLFGGRAFLEATGIGVADYARSGFFELVVVAGLVLGALLLADDLLERTEGPTRRRFRMLGQLLVALVVAVLVSAALRLALYLEFFGLTADRLFALAVLTWIALVFGWFTLTVLRGVRTRFAPGVLLLSVVWLVAVNLANPERVVVAVNLARAEAGRPFDVSYHAQLSADAVPALLAGADRLPAADAAALRTELRTTWAGRALERADWRAWSLPWARAVRLTR